MLDLMLFLEVCKRNNDILACGIITDEIDKQNLEVALPVFNEGVEENIHKHGDSHTANFVHLLQNWFMASDERGITLKDRLQYLVEMHNYMNQFYDPSEYPPPSTHIYNMPIQSFEMLMQSISMHIACYQLAKKNTFNNRALSTLAIESCFSDLKYSGIEWIWMPKSILNS